MTDQLTVFVVDDDKDIRDLLQVLLKSAGYDVECFASARDFLKDYRADRVGCLLADIGMPDMTGMELLAWLIERRVRLPVIIITGHVDMTTAVRALRAGAAGFIEKPFSIVPLLDAVRRALASADDANRARVTESETVSVVAKFGLLSAIEQRILNEILNGRTAGRIATLLGTDKATVDHHLARVMEILDAKTAPHLVRLALAGHFESGDLQLKHSDEVDPAALLHSLADSACVILGAGLASVTLFKSAQRRVSVGGGPEADRWHSRPSPADDSASRASAITPQASGLALRSNDRQLIALPAEFSAAQAVLNVPLATGGNVFGWLVLLNKLDRGDFTDADEKIAVSLASQVAHTLKLTLELNERVEQQRAVARLGTMALGAVDLQALFDEAARLVAETLRVDFSTVLQLGSARETLVVRAGFGWPDGIVGSTLVSVEQGSLVENALLSNAPFMFVNLPEDSRIRASPFMYASGVISGLVVAIPGMAHPFGTLGAYTATPRRFLADEVDFASTVATVLGQAIVGKQTEESLRRAQKMEAVGLLTGGIAHDFNNLLTVILGNAQILSATNEDEPEVHELTIEIEGAARRGADLTHRLLAFSRRQTLKPSATNITRLAFGMRDLLARTLGASIHVEVLAEVELSPAYVDETQLESALLNLAINARDAMPNGGRLIIETRNAEIDEAFAATNIDLKAGAYVVLAVTDTGTGMAPDVVNRAFEPFFTTKEIGKGSGLGLSMVYGFAQQSGGCVKLYSELGHGTSIQIYLPRAAAGAMAQKTTQGDVTPRGDERILVIEDDIQVRRYVVRQLRELGYSVVQSADGPSGLEALKAEPRIDLAFIDVIMPGGMNGIEVAEAARRIHPELCILMTSGYPESALSQHRGPRPEFELLQKPYQVSELARALRTALGPDRAATAS